MHHDSTIIKRWNEAVSIDDDVWILGDISWHNVTTTYTLIESLNGVKHLCVGNHDKKLLRNPDFRKLFVEICDYKEIKSTEGKDIILSHYPIPCFNRHYYGAYHLYGHVHTGFEYNIMENVRRQMKDLYDAPCNMYNVGCMLPYMNYKPRTLEEIVEGYNRFKKGII